MRVSDPAIGSFLVVFGGAVLLYTRTFPAQPDGHPGPEFFPNILAGLLILAGATLFVQGWRKGQRLGGLDPGELKGLGLVNVLLVLGSVVFYIYLSDFLGFLVTSFIILFGLAKWLRVSLLNSLIAGVGVTLGIYVLFAKVLLVPLPWGLWGW
jgi:putative tricarboxylic transport membrane protein